MQSLRRIPTLAAQVMHQCTGHLLEQGLWPADNRVQPITGEMRAQALGLAQELRARAQASEREMSRLMAGVVAQGGARLALQDRVLKSAQSLSENILLRSRDSSSKGLEQDLEQAARQVGNALRYTVEIAPEELAGTTREMLDALQAKGVARIKVRNAFVHSTTNKGITAQLRTPGGQVFQVEFHTPQSLKVKQQLHGDYKRSQAEALAVRPDAALLGEYADAMRQVCAQVDLPPGVAAIANYDEVAGPRLALGAGPSQAGHGSAGSRMDGIGEKPSTMLAKRLHALAQQRAGGIAAAVLGVVERVGGKIQKSDEDPGKAWKSIRSKIEIKAGQPGSKPELLQAAAKVLDALRYEIVVGEDRFAQGCRQALEELKEAGGMTMLRVKNAFSTPLAPGNPYQGINATFMDAAGQAFEMQFHTPVSAQAKRKSHTAYKVMQSLAARGEALTAKGEALADKDRQNLERQQPVLVEAWRAVQRPAGAGGIDAWQADAGVWAVYRQRMERHLAL